jgi:hypothetical protein
MLQIYEKNLLVVSFSFRFQQFFLTLQPTSNQDDDSDRDNASSNP